MNDVTRILSAIEQGDPKAADQLLPPVYEELRKLAAQKLADEAPGQTLQATALVHDAYLRLVGPDPEQPWANRGHFFAAAAEAMRRILVENARRKRGLKQSRRNALHGSIKNAAAMPPCDSASTSCCSDWRRRRHGRGGRHRPWRRYRERQ